MGSNDIYILMRDSTERTRLDVQNQFYKDILGYTLHPKIVASLPPSPKIADVATGTGAWLLDAAKEFPHTDEFHGFDISDALYSDNAVPSNVHFHVADAKQPFPTEHIGEFDVVNLRLLLPAMRDEDWKIVTKNVLTLLKPGGAIQWTECNFLPLYPALRGIYNALETPDKLNHCLRTWMDLPSTRWPERLSAPNSGWYCLPLIYQELGMKDIMSDIVHSDRLSDPTLRKVATEIELGVVSSAFARSGWNSAEIEKLVGPAREDVEHGAYVSWVAYVNIGWKG